MDFVPIGNYVKKTAAAWQYKTGRVLIYLLNFI